MLRELYIATKKNLVRLFRSKISAAAILIGPLVLILLVGLAFGNTKLHDISVGVYDAVGNDAVTEIVSGLEKNEDTFTVKEFDTAESCAEGVRQSETHICMQFLELEDGRTDVQFYVDYSRLSLVWVLLNAMTSRVSDEAASMGTAISQSLIDKVGGMEQYLAENGEAISEIANKSSELGVRVRDMRALVESVDLSSPATGGFSDIGLMADDQKDAITSQQMEIDSRIDQERANLKRLRADLVTSKNDLEDNTEQLELWAVQLESSEDALGCLASDSTDLTDYLVDEGDLDSIIQTLDRPDCSLLYTTRLNMERALIQSEDAEAQIDSGIKQIDDADAALLAFQKDAASGADEAVSQIDYFAFELEGVNSQIEEGETRLAEIRTLRSEIIDELTLAEEEIIASTSSIEGILAGLDDVRQSIEDVALVTPEAIIRPFVTNVDAVTEDKDQFDFLFPTLLTLIVLFVSVLSASTIVMKERSSNAYFRNFITPSAFFVTFTGVLATGVILSILQVMVITLIGVLFFGISLMPGIILHFFLAVVLGVLFFSLLGMIFGYLFESEETTTLVSLMVCVILFIFSSTLVPIESMQPTLAAVAKLNPFVLMEILLRRVLVFEAGLGVGTAPFWMLILELVVAAVISIVTLRSARRAA